MKKTKKVLYIIAATVLVFAVTNPGVSNFQAKFGTTRNGDVERTNYILFSIFKQDFLISGETYNLRYIGLLGFFINISSLSKH
jgi:hypothetical protein